ncbi:MAG TPA: MerR family transcriptional regulator [Bryobacteraceae bacterium]|nr:MerR family transcriptional regulator [Bryobacteraceae bacterium]
MGKLFQVQEFAELSGVTVRALHHYDRLSLLCPKRTEAGYRLYSLHDLERLEQIVALKFLGIPLRQVKELLDRDTRGLPDVLQSQRQALELKRHYLDQAIAAIREAERAIKPGHQPNAAALKKIIEVIEMKNEADFLLKYYSDGAQAKLAERRQQWTPELQEQTTKAWTDLFHDVEASLGEDPASEKAQALAARWKALVEAFTGADPDIGVGLGKAWADRQQWPDSLQQKTASFSNRDVWQFIEKAMNCRHT